MFAGGGYIYIFSCDCVNDCNCVLLNDCICVVVKDCNCTLVAGCKLDKNGKSFINK